MSQISFIKKLMYVKRGGYFDNDPVFSEFYEHKYLELNPDLHSADVGEKIKIAVKAIDFLVKEKKFKPAKISDVGSGSILILRRLLDYLRQHPGIDPVGLAVDISGAVLQKTDSYDDIVKLRADAMDLPIADHDFDLLILFDLIEHTPEPALVINEALRVAKYVLIKTPLEQSVYAYLRGGAKRLKHLENKFGHIQHFKRADVLSLLGGHTKIVKEYYEIIPHRSFLIEIFQKFLLKLKLYIVFRYVFGGFLVLLITND